MRRKTLTHVIIILAGLATIVTIYLLSIYDEALQATRQGTPTTFFHLLKEDLAEKHQIITNSWNKLIGKKSSANTNTAY